MYHLPWIDYAGQVITDSGLEIQVMLLTAFVKIIGHSALLWPHVLQGMHRGLEETIQRLSHLLWVSEYTLPCLRRGQAHGRVLLKPFCFSGRSGPVFDFPRKSSEGVTIRSKV